MSFKRWCAGWLEFELVGYKEMKPQLSSSNDFKFNFFLSLFFQKNLLGPILLLMIIVILFYFSKPNLSSNYVWLDLHCHIFLMFQKTQALLLWSSSYFFFKTPSNNPHHFILLFFKTWFLWWCSSFSSFVHTSFDQKIYRLCILYN